MMDETGTFSYYRGTKEPTFVTRTELEAAKLFDYYRLAWDYEPRTFVLEQDEQGNITEAFTPDFYLPDLELFIEVTEMKQSLVTVKNRKVRKLREKYPGRARQAALPQGLRPPRPEVRPVSGVIARRADPSPRERRPSLGDRVGDVFLSEETIRARVQGAGRRDHP